MIKNITWLLSVLIVFGSLSACKKVIKLDLNTASPQLVIEGNIYDHSGPYTVKIFQTVNFDESNAYPAVTGANVILSDNAGNSEQLSEIYPGSYITSKINGVPGHTYTLDVNIGGKSYSAISTMPFPVDIESIYFQKSLFGNNKYPGINFIDPANISNYYRLIYLINGIKQEDINVTDDRISAGQTISYTIRPIDTDNKLKTGDVVTIWLEAVDQGVYEYFRTAGREGGQSASPANPTSNISNGALGYFNACSVSALSVVFT